MNLNNLSLTIKNTSQQILSPGKSLLLPLAMILSSLYWLYLASTSLMIVIHDAESLLTLAEIIHQHGWIEYFRTGPSREPLYPLLISLSMDISEILNVSYQSILIFIQILCLLMTQILMVQILRILNTSTVVTSLTILFFGFSPAMINSALSGFSEVTTYPFLCGIILVSIVTWKTLAFGRLRLILLLALTQGLLFIGITSIKGIYEFCFIIYLAPYLFLIVKSFYKRNQKLLTRVGLFLLILIFVFQAFILFWKSMNKKHNGTFAFTDRGAWVIYGSAARRVEPLNSKRFLTALAYIPGEKFCNTVLSPEECYFWGPKNLESIYGLKLAELRKSVPPHQIDPIIFRAAIKKGSENPIQFLLIYSVEWLKTFFWESTNIGFVVYPSWLEQIYRLNLFDVILKFSMAFLSFCATFYLAFYIFKERRQLFRLNSAVHMPVDAYFSTLLMILSHSALYAIFDINPRHILPIAPCFILMIGFFIDRIFIKIKENPAP